MKFQPDDVIDERYRVVSVLGAGASGTVYLAEDQLLKRFMSVKVLAGDSAAKAEKAERFHREARILSQLSHPNIVSVHRYGFLSDGSPFLVLDFVEGHSLRHFIERDKIFNLQKAGSVVRQICIGLKEASEKGIVHRDLKPENVLIANENSNWQIKIIDFGLCKQISLENEPERPKSPVLTQTGITMGTLAYMSPEQRVGHKVDWRSDIYALGCIFFELITGESPFSSGVQRNNLELPRIKDLFNCKSKIVAHIDDFVQKCTAPIASNRFAKHDELLICLDALVSKEPEWTLHKAKHAEPDYRKIGAFSIGIVLVCLIGFYSIYLRIQRSAAAHPAEFRASIEKGLAAGKEEHIGIKARDFCNAYRFANLTEKRRFQYDLFQLFRKYDDEKGVDKDNASLMAVELMRTFTKSAKQYALANELAPAEFSLSVDEVSKHLYTKPHNSSFWMKIYQVTSEQASLGDVSDLLKQFVPGPDLYLLRAESAVRAGFCTSSESKLYVARNLADALARYFEKLSTSPASVRPSILNQLDHCSEQIISVSQPTLHYGIFLGNYYQAKVCLERAADAKGTAEKARFFRTSLKAYDRCRMAIRTDAAEIEDHEFEEFESLLEKLSPLIFEQFVALQSNELFAELIKIQSDHLWLAEKFKEISLVRLHRMELSAAEKIKIQESFEKRNVAKGAFSNTFSVRQFYRSSFYGHLVGFQTASSAREADVATKELRLACDFAKKSGPSSEQFLQILKTAQHRNYPN